MKLINDYDCTIKDYDYTITYHPEIVNLVVDTLRGKKKKLN